MSATEFTTDLIAELAKHRLNAAITETGGGCQALAIGRDWLLVTNGDAELPDGEDTLVVEYDDEGDACAEFEVDPSRVTASEQAAAIAEWARTRMV